MNFGLQLGKRIRNVGRMAQITNVFARQGFWSVAERINVKSWLTPEQFKHAEHLSKGTDAVGLPVRLRESFEQLGPAFVKLGQLLAGRDDLIPLEYVEEFRKLHKDVANLPFSDIKEVIEAELGPEKLADFESIDETPLAAGSIGQVHTATLKTGEKVVIKVQRPGVAESIATDLSLMEELATMLEKYVPESRGSRPRSMVLELGRALQGEVDFIREGGNIEKFRRNFAENKNIVFPEVFWKYSTPKVLTQSFIVGIDVSNRDKIIDAGLNPVLLVEHGLEMFMKMVYIDGFYHGDLHPGNLLALPDNKIGVLDSGIAVHISRGSREHLAELLICLVKEDFEGAVQHFLELAEPSVDFNVQAFEHDISNAIAPFVGLKLSEIRSGNIFSDLARLAAKHGAPLPQELIIYIKTLATFEGLGHQLNPNFDLLETCEKFAGDIAKEIYSPENIKHQAMVIVRDITQLARHAPLQVRRLLKASLDGDLSLNIIAKDVEKLSRALDRSSSRIAVAMIIGALIIGSSILTFARVGAEYHQLPIFGLVGFALAGFLGMYVIFSVLRGRGR